MKRWHDSSRSDSSPISRGSSGLDDSQGEDSAVKLTLAALPIVRGASLLAVHEQAQGISRALVSIAELFEGCQVADLASRFLTSWEMTALEKLESHRRQREWLSGRLLAKALALSMLEARSLSVCASDLEIRPTLHGAPKLVAAKSKLENALVNASLSLSHSHGHAAALLALDGLRLVGVDVEKIRPRTPAFIERVFSERERALLSSLPLETDAGVILAWTLKEATAKAMKRGLPDIVPWYIELLAIDDVGRARLELNGSAFNRFTELGAVRLDARAVIEGEHATADVCITLSGCVGPRLSRVD